MDHPGHKIAERLSRLDASGIRKVFDLAAGMKNPINLSIGQPDFDVPEAVKKAATGAIENGFNKYTQTQGTPELRESIAEQCRIEFGWDDAHDRTYLVTSGVSGALLLLLETLVDPGDEVIFADPYFVMYSHLVHLTGGIPVKVNTYPDFRLTAERLEAAITDRTRMILLNNPSNPTGMVSTKKELEHIACVCSDHGLLVISDEIYNFFCYDQEFISMASLYNNTLLLRGFSKSYAMTGWRIGWVTGPASILEKMIMLQQYTFVCAPSMAQVAAIEAMKTDMTEQIKNYRKKRDMVYDALSEKFGLIKPGGAFYAFVPSPHQSATEFVEKAIKNNVLIIPGKVFSDRDTHFRISYATDNEKLSAGLEILRSLAN